MWPGLVGKGPGAEPFIDLDTMLNLTAQAEVNGQRFDGVDLFLSDPHISIDSSSADIHALARKIAGRDLLVGSLVAPVWSNTGGGSAMASQEEQQRFLLQVEKACRIGASLRDEGIRPYGIIRVDSAAPPSDWASEPESKTDRLVDTFRRASDIAENYDERLAAEGEICWGGMHSWRKMANLLERVGRPERLGFQADMAHTLLYVMGYNALEDRLLPPDFDWSDRASLMAALEKMIAVLRPWTIDFHVAQNDATVKGTGAHDKTGRHCLPADPHGKLDIVAVAGLWLRDQSGAVRTDIRHICWDGCMFPNEVMHQPETWRQILATMLAVRDAHGWSE